MNAQPDGASDWVMAPWAKALNGNIPHPLVCHSIDTAAVAEALYDVVLGPRVRAEIEEGLAPLESPRNWVAVLCGLHDLGKLSPTFQARRADIAVKRMGVSAERALRAAAPDPEIGRTDTAHGLLTAAHFHGWLELRKAEPRFRTNLTHLLGGHHGWFPNPKEVSASAVRGGHLGDGAWAWARDALLRTVAELWSLDPDHEGWPHVVLSTAAAVGLAGLTVLSDWTASDASKFPYKKRLPGLEKLPSQLRASELAAYRDYAREQARRVLQRINWVPWRPPADTRHTALFPEDSAPRPLQHAIGKVVAGRTRPGMLVVEAPTGEGKTKAGLQAAASLVRDLGLAGMYVAMPSRATARPAHALVNEMLAATGAGLRAHLLYSGARDDPARAGSDSDSGSVLVPSEVSAERPEELAEALMTFTGKRALTFPIGVGTIDQALQAAIRSGHVFVRLTSLSNKVLVVDEVHAYDSYTSWLLDRLLWWCGRLGVPVVLMSATLPAPRREELLAAWRAGARVAPPSTLVEPVTEPGGGQLTWVEADYRAPTEPVEVSASNPRRQITLRRIADDYDAVAGEALKRVREGGCVAVIHNAPARAARTHQRLERLLAQLAQPPELLYLDGKMEDEPRRAVEERLLARCGPDAAEPRHVIVVGTQVLEHGLDTDYDLVITDPCPIDLLIQRAGRLHRHPRANRPASLSSPHLVVVRPSGKNTFPPPTASIYAKSCLMVTEWELSRRDTLLLPDDVPKLVHAVYVEPAVVADEKSFQAWEEARKRREISVELDSYRGEELCVPMLRDSETIIRLTRHSTSPRQTRKSSRPDTAGEGAAEGARERSGKGRV